MTNEMVLERTSNLVMPSHYVELDKEEMSYVNGGLGPVTWFFLGIVAGCATGWIADGAVTATTGKSIAEHIGGFFKSLFTWSW